MTGDGLDLEARLLSRLCEETVAQWGDDDGSFTAIVDDLTRLRQRDDFGNLASETELDNAAARLRAACLRRAHRSTDEVLKSPPLSVPRRTPSGQTVWGSYERGLASHGVESRLIRDDLPDGWAQRHIAVNNGMGAISLVMDCTVGLFSSPDQPALSMGTLSAYYETDVVAAVHAGAGMRIHRMSTLAELAAAVSRDELDIVFVESVMYNWDLDAIAPAALVKAIADSQRVKVVVVDTTLSGFTWPTARLLEALPESSPAMVIETRSGLKLDQQGIELANVGVISVFDRSQATVDDIAEHVTTVRTVTGRAVPFDATAVLDAPFALDAQWTRRHAGQVFINNASLAGELAAATGGVFSRVAHPGIGHQRAHAPFVVCRLAEDTLDNHGFILGVIADNERRYGACLTRGASFGFRGHRVEVVVPRLADRLGLLKIAMGARRGPQFTLALHILRSIADATDINELRAAYPNVEPIPVLSDAGAPRRTHHTTMEETP